MNLVSTLGIDLAKNTFSVHGVNSNGAVVLRRTVSRSRLTELVTQLPPCLIRMEACSGAHEWARRFSGCGHTVKLMAPKFVAPYRKSGKNDDNDAEAICEAVSRPNMRCVPVKSAQQQADLSLHRVRQGFIEARTVTLNRIRGLLAESGYVLALSREIFGVWLAHWAVLLATLLIPFVLVVLTFSIAIRGFGCARSDSR